MLWQMLTALLMAGSPRRSGLAKSEDVFVSRVVKASTNFSSGTGAPFYVVKVRSLVQCLFVGSHLVFSYLLRYNRRFFHYSYLKKKLLGSQGSYHFLLVL